MALVATAPHARLLPTGNSWYGCREEVALDAFFARGHDKVAEAALLTDRYNSSVAERLCVHEYDADHSVNVDAVKSSVWGRCPNSGRNYSGAPTSVRNHCTAPH